MHVIYYKNMNNTKMKDNKNKSIKMKDNKNKSIKIKTIKMPTHIFI